MKHNYRLTPIITVLALLIASTISACAESTVFPDIQNHWAKADIKVLVDKGAIKGYEDGTFRPNATITRAEFTTIALNAMDSDGSKVKAAVEGAAAKGTATLERIGADRWEASTVVAANYYGLQNLCGMSKAEWEKPITRAEMAFVSVTLAENIGGQSLNTKEGIENNIADITAVSSDSYKDSILKAYSNGILSGVDNKGTFNPAGTATRAESCAIIIRVIDPTQRITVEIKKAPDTSEATTINQSDPYRRSVKEGDTFITTDGQKITVKKNPVTGTYNPEAAVGFDLGRDNINGPIELGSVSDGSDGGVLGDVMLKGPNGHIAWTSTWKMIYNSGWDKPTTPGTSDGQRSPNKLYVWNTQYQMWGPDEIVGRL